MAKDGTMRGGPRPGQGRPRKALVDKIQDGTANSARVMSEPAEFVGADVPPVKEYMKATQKNGKGLAAPEIYANTYAWLQARGCDKLVSPQLIEQYAMSVSRWIQCEECISEYGFLAKHPTTGNAIASPYVAMSRDYMKQVNSTWFAIYQIVKENCSVDYSGPNPPDDVMQRLLRARNGGR